MANTNFYSSEHEIEDFKCPITRLYFSEPVCANDGFFYEKEALEYYLQDGNTSPMNPSIPIENYHNNVFFSRLIKKYIQEKDIDKDLIYEKGLYKIQSKDSINDIQNNTDAETTELVDNGEYQTMTITPEIDLNNPMLLEQIEDMILAYIAQN